MKKLNLIIGLLLLPVILFLPSCKEDYTHQLELEPNSELELSEPMAFVNTSEYERVVAEDVVMEDEVEGPTKGIIEYWEKGERTAYIDFEEWSPNGTKRDHNCGNGQNDRTDRMQNDRKDRDKAKDRSAQGSISERARNARKDKRFTKVVVEPLVAARNCDYIVAGTIKYYDGRTWVATIDFGNGECDDLATKVTKDGRTSFSLDRWK